MDDVFGCHCERDLRKRFKFLQRAYTLQQMLVNEMNLCCLKFVLTA